MAVQLLDKWLLGEQDKLIASYQELNQVGITQPEIIFLGDSIIEYFPLQELLRTDKQLVNRGVRGYKSQQILENFTAHIYGSSLEQVFLLIGTNDLAKEIPVAEIVDNVDILVNLIRREQPQARVHLISVLPVNENPLYQDKVYIRTNAAIRELNQAYLDLAEREDLVYISAHEALADSQGQLSAALTTDGLHLSVAGYVTLSRILQPYLLK